jgi:hypothetical protein
MGGFTTVILAVAVAVAASPAAALCANSSMPQPWTRVLEVANPAMKGTDVFILQNLLLRSTASLPVTSAYDAATAAAVLSFQRLSGLSPDGVFGPLTAAAALTALSPDGFKWNGTAPGALGFKYMVHVPVHTNRSTESVASLIAANGSVVYSYVVRAHGIDAWDSEDDPPAWPYFNDCCDGMAEFAGNGNTPTGLSLLDLNSPEPIPSEFGPYPINRVVQGLEGNAGFLIPLIRDGILMHTGEWANYSNWQPPAPMPNSLGCIHAWPESIYTVWQLLVGMGVEVRNNTDGVLPYPYKPQGLIAVELVD